MYDHILVPTDGNTGSAHVAMQAINLAGQYGSVVHVVHVLDTDVRALLPNVPESGEGLRRRGREAVERIERMASSHGVPVETAIREGDPAEEILSYADEVDADIVVAGTHGRSGVRRRLIGSVAERLVRHASCPVMTVGLPETDVTVEDREHARRLARDALGDRDATIAGVDHQVSVWVVDAETDEGRLVVYIDPVTQRTSVVDVDGKPAGG